MIYRRDDQGYSRGGLDVVTAVNLFFKGILLFPVFLLAGYIGLMMMKHMIFQGIPSLTAPTLEQREQIHERNHQIGLETKEEPSVAEDTLSGLSGSEAMEEYKRKLSKYREDYDEWMKCQNCRPMPVSPTFNGAN